MNEQSFSSSPVRSPNWYKTVFLTGLLAGTLDITAAIIHFLIRGGHDPVQIFIYIASGVFGQAAYSGNAAMPVLGLIFHYVIAFIWTILFFITYPRVSLLRKNKYISAIIYGAFIWLVMNLIVVPLSSVRQFPFRIDQALTGVAILIVAIGFPVSLIASRYFAIRSH